MDEQESTGKLKLLIATDCFLPRWDGIARFLDELLPHLAPSYDITIIAPDFPGEYTPSYNAKIIRVPLQPFSFGDYKPARFASSIISQHIQECDIVWSQTAASIAYLAKKFARKYKKPHLTYIHSIDWQLVERAAGKNIFRNVFRAIALRHVRNLLKDANLIMVPSQEVIENLRWYGINSPCKVIPLGVNTHNFIPAQSRAEAKRLIGLDSSSPVIGYVGRLSREKDLPTLFSAIEQVRMEFTNVTVLIVGDGLNEIKHRYMNIHNVHFVGSQNNVVPYLQAMDAYVLPSLIETTSLTTLEAMSCETPIVATKVGMVKEYISEKENGLLFPQKNHYVLALKLKWILQNPNKARTMAKNARQTVIDNFDWQITTKRIKAIFDAF